jgi:hypothetical protein
VNDVKHLAEAGVQMEAERSGRMVDGNHPQHEVRRVGTDIEGAQAIEARSGIVEVRVEIAIEQEAEVRTPAVEDTGIHGRRRHLRYGSCRRRLFARRSIWYLRVSHGRITRE